MLMISSHVRFLLMEINDSDYDSLAQEICEFFDYGLETSICVLKTCLDCFTFRKSQANTLQLENVISLVLKRVLAKPNFETLISHALKDFEVTEEFLNDMAIALQFSTTERITFGLALTYSERSDASTSGRSFCMAEIERLCANPLQIESAEQIHNIFLFLRLSEDVSKHLDSFLQILSSSQSSDKLQLVLRTMDFLNKSLKNNADALLTEIEKETDVGGFIEELSYGFTADASTCKKILSLFLPLTEATISRILVVVVRNYAGRKGNYNTSSTFSLSPGCSTSTELPALRSWNVDILFETINQLAPGTRWMKVIENLDYEGFDIPNMEAFEFFMRVVRNICKDPFPLHAICSFVWKNVEGQLSFLKHAVLASPEIFTFVHSARKLAYSDNMHSHEQLGLSNHAWLSLDLLDVLCQLAERGHAVSVHSLLQYPLEHFPRTLLLGMAHIKTAYNIIQREVVSDMLPRIIKNTQDSGFVLNLWQLNRELVVWGLLDAQNLGPDSMFRIIEICHELKILSAVIESVPLSFGIRLAILASRKRFLDTEWLSNCIFLYKDVFFEEYLKIIKDIHYGESKDISSKQFHFSDPISDLYLDAISLFLNALQPYTNEITSPQLFEEIEKVHAAILAPTSEVQDKISFIMNNVSEENIESKGKEFAEILSIQYYPWFAQYMVMKRVSVERKFHDLYLKFLDKVNSQPLYKEIVQATYENCKVLLGSDLIKSSSDERSLLKNLGSWLGKVTIGRNYVLRAREIDLKPLIVDAYEKGLLIAIIPFTSKVLEPCQSSIAYQPPNPWTMSILGLLSEIYSMPNLKMNLKFDIELLFKNLGVDIKDVKPTSLLKDRKREIDGNPDFRNKDFSVVKVRYVEPDPAGFQKQVSMLFTEWYQICKLPGENEAACTRYVMHLHQSGLLKGDDKTESFFRILTEHSVAHCISSQEINSGGLQSSQQVQNPSFISIDIYAKLVFSILNYFREQESRCKSFLFSKIMAVTVRSMFKDADNKKTSLDPRPYFRLFINWLLDLCSLDPMTDDANCQVLIAFANVFHALQPLKFPAFSFAWLELVSHRSFMPKLLSLHGQKGWPYVQRLLMGLLQFLEPFLRNAELRGPVHCLYKGTLKILLVLLHDYPEFLCNYHFTFCNVIPSSCIQMRNIILSSFPRNMRVPDPFTPNLKIDQLPEIVEAPCILSEVDAALKEKQMKSDLDEYLSMRQHNSSFLNKLKQRLLSSTNEADSTGTRYNVPLLNSLVLYAGMQAIQQLQAGVSENANVAAVQMFKYLSWELDTEGRYLLLDAIANQLRYPNSHTHYFSFIMLCLFLESDQEITKEQVTRVLLERLMGKRPQPWGILVTFIELVKNPRYGFWEQDFTRCKQPEIEKLFASVARFCGGMKSDMVST